MTVAAKFEVSDYHRMIEAGILADRRVELIDGIIIEMPPESPEHSSYSWNLADKFRSVFAGRALVREGKPVTLSTANSEPQPDIALVREPRSLYLPEVAREFESPRHSCGGGKTTRRVLTCCIG